MARVKVSIVIPVWNEWHFTQLCLDHLHATLSPGDEVIVVDNGSEDDTPKKLPEYRWVKTITNETNRGFAKACNQGAWAASNPIIIFLNNDTITPAKWIEGLVEPFSDSLVGSVGPVSNFVSRAQLVPVCDYNKSDPSDFKRFAKQWRRDHRGERQEVDILIGFCLAVQSALFQDLQGFDESFEIGSAEDDDLALRIKQKGYKQIIARDVFVHHFGHATFTGNGLNLAEIEEKNVKQFRAKHGLKQITQQPSNSNKDDALVSVAMIVKDEKVVLERCLQSLAGVVDEVCIYDTGSTDGSIELATQLGAKVKKGQWEDDFSKARNQALQMCSGDWILILDADEEYTGDTIAFRQNLMNTKVNAFQVEIINVADDEKNNVSHRPCRLFRNGQYHYKGRLHEQVVPNSGSLRPDIDIAPYVVIRHYGYLPSEMERKNKADRNIRIAQFDVDDASDGVDMVDKLTNLGRSHSISGNYEEALSLFTNALNFKTKSVVVERTLYRAGAQAAFGAGRLEDSIQWANRLKKVSKRQDGARFLRASAYIGMSKWSKVLEELEGLDNMSDDDGVVFPQHMVHANRAIALKSLKQWEQSANEFEKVIVSYGLDNTLWPTAIDSFYQAGRDFSKLIEYISPEETASSLANISLCTPEAAHLALTALWEDPERSAKVLGLAVRVAPSFECAQAIEWSVRFRTAGMPQHCPLTTKAWDTQVAPRERLLALAFLNSAFEDTGSNEVMKFIGPELNIDDFMEIIYEINELSPALLEPVITAVSNTPERALAMAKVLHAYEATDEAIAVTMYGFENASQEETELCIETAKNWLSSIGAQKAVDELVTLVSQS